MKKAKRVFLIVLDSFGIGELPDANKFGDEGSNTLKALKTSNKLNIKTLEKFGLNNIVGVGGGVENPIASYAKMSEKSNGKDTTVGHFEIALVGISFRPALVLHLAPPVCCSTH